MTEVVHVTPANVNDTEFVVVFGQPLDATPLVFSHAEGWVQRDYRLNIHTMSERTVFTGTVEASGALTQTKHVHFWILSKDLPLIRAAARFHW